MFCSGSNNNMSEVLCDAFTKEDKCGKIKFIAQKSVPVGRGFGIS